MSYILYLAIFIVFDCYSQWTFVGGPEGALSNEVLFTRSGSLISSTLQQGIFISVDSGRSWRNVDIYPDFGGVYSISEMPSGEIMAVTQTGIAKSTDTGDSWSLVHVVYGLNDFRTSICGSPVDSSMFYGADDKFYKSSDRGLSWTEVWSGSFIDCYAIDDSGSIFLGARTGQLLRSTNGGASFEQFSIGYPLGDAIIQSIQINSQGELYVDLYNPDVILHYDHGQSSVVYSGWTNVPLGLTNNGDLIYKKENCFARFDRSTKTSSTLSCDFWIKDQFAKKMAIHSNTFVSNFQSEGLYVSTNAGETWSSINKGHGYKGIRSIEITPEGKMFAGTFGWAFWAAVYRSTDNGVNWARVDERNIDAFFVDISRLKTGNVIASGTFGSYVIDPTTLQWTKPPGLSLVYSQHVAPNGMVFAGNDIYGIYRSHDNGNTWSHMNNGLSHWIFFGFGDGNAGRIFAAAWQFGSYYSDNYGITWTPIASAPLTYLRAFHFTHTGDTVLAGTSGGVAFSLDNGLTWNESVGIYSTVSNLALAPNGHILAATYGEGVYRSTTNGRTWEPFNSGIEGRLVYELSFEKSGILFAATDLGLYRNDDFIVPPRVLSVKQNYPNPFNSGTTLEFSVPNDNHVTIKVYNVLGEEITTLLDTYLLVGHYTERWEPHNLPSGLYFLHVKAGNHIRVSKALLLR